MTYLPPLLEVAEDPETEASFMLLDPEHDNVMAGGVPFKDVADRLALAWNTHEEVLTTLRSILASSDHTGLWRDPSGNECNEEDEGARFEEFTLEEQNAQLASVAEQTRALLKKLTP